MIKMDKNNVVSKCCKAEYIVRGGTKRGQTYWQGCKQCGKDCDIIDKRLED